MNKEIRNLTRGEFFSLINHADKNETLFLTNKADPFDFFKTNAIEQNGLVINKKPIYFGALLQNGKNELWTVVNSGVKEQFTLYKETKKVVLNWLDKYGSLSATMFKGNDAKIRWTEKLGFKKIKENANFIEFLLTGG